MTYREKWKQDHPKMSPGDLHLFYCHFCPDCYFDAEEPDDCVGTNETNACTRCWDREISKDK